MVAGAAIRHSRLSLYDAIRTFTTTDRALMTRIMWRNPTAGSRTLQMLFPVVHSVSWSGRHNVFANSVMHLMQDKAAEMTTCFADGSPGWIRTSDHSVNSRTHNRCASDPETKKPRTMAGLGIHSCHTQQWQHIRISLLICSLNCKHVV